MEYTSFYRLFILINNQYESVCDLFLKMVHQHTIFQNKNYTHSVAIMIFTFLVICVFLLLLFVIYNLFYSYKEQPYNYETQPLDYETQSLDYEIEEYDIDKLKTNICYEKSSRCYKKLKCFLHNYIYTNQYS